MSTNLDSTLQGPGDRWRRIWQHFHELQNWATDHSIKINPDSDFRNVFCLFFSNPRLTRWKKIAPCLICHKPQHSWALRYGPILQSNETSISRFFEGKPSEKWSTVKMLPRLRCSFLPNEKLRCRCRRLVFSNFEYSNSISKSRLARTNSPITFSLLYSRLPKELRV